MEIEITSRKENKILEREEVAFTLHFEGKTPSRKQIKQKLKDVIGRNVIVIEYVKPVYGASQANGYARGYTSPKQARALEQQHILERNNLAGGQEQPAEAEKEEKTEEPEEASAETEEEPEEDEGGEEQEEEEQDE